MDDKPDKEENKNDGPTARSTISVDAPDWKYTAASTSQVLFIVSSFASFALNVYINTVLTDYKFCS